MSVSRDDFSIAFRSALLQRGGAQKFSVLSLIFLALIIFSVVLIVLSRINFPAINYSLYEKKNEPNDRRLNSRKN